jgi:hypothetical protein
VNNSGISIKLNDQIQTNTMTVLSRIGTIMCYILTVEEIVTAVMSVCILTPVSVGEYEQLHWTKGNISSSDGQPLLSSKINSIDIIKNINI